jgi:hypothetical protein
VEPKETIIYMHALASIYAPHTLKIKGYIKHRSIVVLIDSGSTHNFIHSRVVEEVNCFFKPVSNFQILIDNGGTMKCGGNCENVKLQMDDYHMKTHMFSITMGGCDIVLGVEWLLGTTWIINIYSRLTPIPSKASKLAPKKSSVLTIWKISSRKATAV